MDELKSPSDIMFVLWLARHMIRMSVSTSDGQPITQACFLDFRYMCMEGCRVMRVRPIVEWTNGRCWDVQWVIPINRVSLLELSSGHSNGHSSIKPREMSIEHLNVH